MKVSTFLMASKALIDTPDKWISYGVEPDYDRDDRSCAWQALTLTEKQARPITGSEFGTFKDAEKMLASVLPANELPALRRIWEWNDASGRTHAEVMDAYDRAIEAAKKAEEVAA